MPTYNVNGITFSVTERGKGFPLVLLHAFPVNSAMFSAQLAGLSDVCRVITPDLRGFGSSASNDAFTIESLADDIHALLQQMNVLPCVLGGVSMGGYIALAYEKKYPADLRGLLLIDTKAEADSAEAKEARQKMIDLVRNSGPPAVAEKMAPKMLAKHAVNRRPQHAQALQTMMEKTPAKTIEHALVAMRDRPDRSGGLKEIKVPTLVIVGDQDVVTPPDGAQKMAKAIPGATFVEIQGAGHLSPMEQPEQVNRAIRRFIFMEKIAKGM